MFQIRSAPEYSQTDALQSISPLPLTLFSCTRCLQHSVLSLQAVPLILRWKHDSILFLNSCIKQAGLAHQGAGLHVMSIQLST